MFLKAGLLLWFVAFVLLLVAKRGGRTWMARLFLGGFCLLLLGFFLRLIFRAL